MNRIFHYGRLEPLLPMTTILNNARIHLLVLEVWSYNISVRGCLFFSFHITYKPSTELSLVNQRLHRACGHVVRILIYSLFFWKRFQFSSYSPLKCGRRFYHRSLLLWAVSTSLASLLDRLINTNTVER